MSLQEIKDSKQGNLWRKQFTVNDKRTTIRLGKLSKRNARTVSAHIDNLLEASEHATNVPAETTSWLRSAPKRLIKQLAKHGLCKEFHDPTIKEFIKLFKDMRKGRVRPRTLYNYELAERYLLEFFEGTKKLVDVSKADADKFYSWLLDHSKLNENTANRRVGRVREFFNEAVEQDLIVVNPFKKRSIKTMVKPAKKPYVSAGDVKKVIKNCPSTEWKLLFAFSRWIGCRIPSEIEKMNWECIDFEGRQMLIYAPKTDSERVVPIFDEVFDLLCEQRDTVGKDAEYVFPSLRHHSNLGTTARKYVKRAGLEVWPKFFNTLRANRETELMDEYGIGKACEWIGNSPSIAMKNYRVQKGSSFDDTDRLNKKCTTKRTKHSRELGRTGQQPNSTNPEKYGIVEQARAWESEFSTRGGT